MIKKILPWFIFAFFIGVLVVIFMMKDEMDRYMSKMIVNQTTGQMRKSGLKAIDSLYNYSQNQKNYKVTILCFGANNCVACKRMKKVMKEIHSNYPKLVNIVNLNVLKAKDLKYMKLFGIATIPSQVLLDERGQEFFRNSGYYSSEDLTKAIENQLNQKPI